MDKQFDNINLGVVELYTIYDSGAQVCGPIFEAVNLYVAQREFDRIMETMEESQRIDYVLIKLGLYNKYECKIEVDEVVCLTEVDKNQAKRRLKSG